MYLGLLHVVLATASIVAARPSAPPVPLAQGRAQAILHVVRKARRCGLKNLRIERFDYSDEVLFVEQPASNDAARCAGTWVGRRARVLGLRPRWPGDDYSNLLF
jgi:hypothetical protein